MGTSDDVSARLRALSVERLEVTAGDLRPDALLGDDLGVDSLAAIEWGMSIEDEFDVSLPEDAWGFVRSYGMVEELVLRLVRRRAAVPGTTAAPAAPDVRARAQA